MNSPIANRAHSCETRPPGYPSKQRHKTHNGAALGDQVRGAVLVAEGIHLRLARLRRLPLPLPWLLLLLLLLRCHCFAVCQCCGHEKDCACVNAHHGGFLEVYHETECMPRQQRS